MSDRYKPMGLEMLPAKRYDIRATPDVPGAAWIYLGERGIATLAFDGQKVLSVKSKNMQDLRDNDLCNAMQRFILLCAEAGKTIEEAKTAVKKRFGDPAFVVPLKSINNPEPDVRPAIEAQM